MEIHQINIAEGAYLLNNSLVIMLLDGEWYIRRFDPNETFDSGWDVYLDGKWCAAACLCFQTSGYKTSDEALAVAKTLNGFC